MQTAQSSNQHIGIAQRMYPQDIRLLSIRTFTEHAASIIFSDPVNAMYRRGCRVTPDVFARQVAIYLSHVLFGLTLTQTGALFERDRTTVAHGCGVVEDCRDNPELDQALDIIGVALRWRLERAGCSGSGGAHA